MMKDSSMGVRAGLCRSGRFVFEECRRNGTAHTRSSRLATVISKVMRPARPSGACRRAAPDPTLRPAGPGARGIGPNRRKGILSPVGEPRMVPVSSRGSSPCPDCPRSTRPGTGWAPPSPSERPGQPRGLTTLPRAQPHPASAPPCSAPGLRRSSAGGTRAQAAPAAPARCQRQTLCGPASCALRAGPGGRVSLPPALRTDAHGPARPAGPSPGVRPDAAAGAARVARRPWPAFRRGRRAVS
jgi:hypothetical protein